METGDAGALTGALEAGLDLSASVGFAFIRPTVRSTEHRLP